VEAREKEDVEEESSKDALFTMHIRRETDANCHSTGLTPSGNVFKLSVWGIAGKFSVCHSGRT
jgi:hypothetical protein